MGPIRVDDIRDCHLIPIISIVCTFVPAFNFNVDDMHAREITFLIFKADYLTFIRRDSSVCEVKGSYVLDV